MEFGFFYESLLEWVRSIYITYIIRKCPRIFLDLNVILLNLTIIPGCTWIQPIHINALKKKKLKRLSFILFIVRRNIIDSDNILTILSFIALNNCLESEGMHIEWGQFSYLLFKMYSKKTFSSLKVKKIELWLRGFCVNLN